jgi:hypothetical protein
MRKIKALALLVILSADHRTFRRFPACVALWPRRPPCLIVADCVAKVVLRR